MVPLQAWGVPGGEAKFEALDADGKGFILFDEFAAWALKLQVAKAGAIRPVGSWRKESRRFPAPATPTRL